MKYFLIFFICCVVSIGAESVKEKYKLNLQSVYYLDHRDYNTLSVITSAGDLPLNLSFWGFTDFHGNQLSPIDRSRLTYSFSEYRLTYDLEDLTGVEGLGFQGEYNYFSKSDKDVARFGPVYKHSLSFLPDGSWLQWRVFPVQTDDGNSQFSLIYKFVIAEKWSVSGFADYNLNDDAQDRWVIEPQLNYIINDYLSCHLEYRYNGYEDANDSVKGHGVAFGVGLRF
jgi:hypothetical protein